MGDWTQDLFRLGLEQPRLPLWITAAQPSLMEKSIYYNKGKSTACCLALFPRAPYVVGVQTIPRRAFGSQLSEQEIFVK